MSTIITHDGAMGMFKLIIHAPDSRTLVTGTDFEKWVIQIDGYTDKPFIHSVRFIGCIVIADDMSAFTQCYFDNCEMKIKDPGKQDLFNLINKGEEHE